MTRNTIIKRLREGRPDALADLWLEADRVRNAHVGDAVHLRGLVEVTNHCRRRCAYCGLRAENCDIQRYVMTEDEVLACAYQACKLGYGTIVIQGGETPRVTRYDMAHIVRRIKAETDLAVTLSLGERDEADFAEWRRAGADRYLIRFETSAPELYGRLHPDAPRGLHKRLHTLRTLRRLGYEIGSGVLIGVPGQTIDMLADDILLFRELDLDMIGVGPYIPHPRAPIPQCETTAAEFADAETMTYKTIALARLVCPGANIPSTTALGTLNKAMGRENGLRRGANVVMPNLTPVRYRALYEIYPDKACIAETAEQCSVCLAGRVASIGRFIGTGRGDSPNHGRRSHQSFEETEIAR